MKNTEHVRQIDFNRIKSNKNVDYMDDGIAFHTDLRELPIENGSMQVNMVTIVTCINGKLQVELNAIPYTIRQYEILVCLPNSIIDNCMLSPDFRGSVFCLSQSGILEQISENEIWDKVFQFAENPIVQVSEENFNMFKLYGSMLKEKVKMKHTPYYKEIIVSIVKASLYELLANVKNKTVTYGKGLTKQREVLFKRFIELIHTTRIKPRNVSWYAEQLCVTPKYLSTVSKRVSGKTAFDWINEYVLIDIRYRLKNTNKTIKEIADILEFPNISFFGKYCRAHFGMSPTEFRKQLRDIPN